MLKGEFRRDKFKFDYDHPDDFTKCFWQKKPNVLPIWITYRFFVSLNFLVVSPAVVVFERQAGLLWYKQLLYVYCWTNFLQLLVFLIAFIITVARFVKEKKNPELPPSSKMPWIYKTLWALYGVVASSTFLVTATFWFFAYNPEKNKNLFYEIESTTMNSFFMIVDVLLNAIPIRFLHFYLPILLVIVYFSFTCIYQTSGGTGPAGIPIYDIVDWRRPINAAAMSFLCVISVFIVHSGLFGLHLAKRWLKKPREEEEEE